MLTKDWLKPVVHHLAQKESLAVDQVTRGINNGTLVSLCSKQRAGSSPESAILVGALARPKVVAFIGATSAKDDPKSEVGLTVIDAAGADAAIDLSITPDTLQIRKQIRDVWTKPLGVCVTYDYFRTLDTQYTTKTFREATKLYLSCAPDWVCIHPGATSELLQAADRSSRIMPTTSRGGGLVWSYLRKFGGENPLIEFFDILLEEMAEIGAVIDLGDVFRPGCTADAGDEMKEREVYLQAELRERAMAAGVQVLCESGGHMTVGQIVKLLPQYKRILGGAPLWIAGPLITDRGVTFDAVVNALGILTAAQNGGDMFASVTNVEHYRMPMPKDTAESVRYARIALDAILLDRRDPEVVERNNAISRYRRQNKWEDQAIHALFPNLAHNEFLASNLTKNGQPCTVCGPACPHVRTGGIELPVRN